MLVDHGVDDEPGTAAVGGGPLIARRVLGLRRALGLVQQFGHPHVDLPLRCFGQSVVLLKRDLQPPSGVASHLPARRTGGRPVGPIGVVP